jgi:cellulose synthase/poly-beta-1,6-N-acetylglucosamine synthase-like glycosyltransferase
MIIQILFFTVSILLTFVFFVYGFNHYYLLTAARRYKPPKMPAPILDLPPVCVHLAIYNEKYVVRRLVTACVNMASYYGREKVRIMILDDSNDDTVQEVDDIVAETTRNGFHVEVLRRDNRQGFKAGALKNALSYTSEEYIALFDADFIPESDFLNRTVPYFTQDDCIGIVQSRWCHLNRDYNLLTFAVAIGIDIHFWVEQPARYVNGLYQNFNGSGGVLRKKAILDSGGWEADTLTEDLDLSYRMQLNGYRILYLRDIDSPGEIPPTVPSFKQQQGRWANGSMRTARKILPTILRNNKLDFKHRFQAFVHLTGYLIHPLMIVSFILACIGTFANLNNLLAAQALLFPHPYALDPSIGAAALALYTFERSAWTILGPLIVLCTIAPWISTFAILRFEKFPFLRNLLGFLVLLLLGFGLSISNTFEIFKGLFSKRSWEFVRTPKYANLENSTGWQKRKYQTPFKPVWAVEFIFVVMGLAAITYAIVQKNMSGLPVLIPFTTAYLFIFTQTILQSRRRPA